MPRRSVFCTLELSRPKLSFSLFFFTPSQSSRSPLLLPVVPPPFSLASTSRLSQNSSPISDSSARKKTPLDSRFPFFPFSFSMFPPQYHYYLHLRLSLFSYSTLTHSLFPSCRLFVSVFRPCLLSFLLLQFSLRWTLAFRTTLSCFSLFLFDSAVFLQLLERKKDFPLNRNLVCVWFSSIFCHSIRDTLCTLRSMSTTEESE